MADVDSKLRGPRACVTCAKAKARCIPGPEDADKCERCHRLQKPCGSQIPAPPRAKKVIKTTRVAELEKRLDQLTSQLHSSQAPPPRASKVPCKGRIAMNHLFPSASIGAVQEKSPISPSTSPGGYGEGKGSSGTPPSSSSSWSGSVWPNPAEAAAMLDNYRATREGLFPFVVVPANLSEEELRTKRPLLWKAIMTVGRFLDGTGQMTMGTELLNEISQAAFVTPQKNLDMLHGLQLLVAWLHYCTNGFQLTNMLFLCRSLCIALRIAKDTGVHDSAGLDRMRAFAGSYFVNSLIFTTEKLPDGLMNMAYLDTCCSVLEAKMEYPSDQLLVHLVRIQKLAQNIVVTLDSRSGNVLPMQPPLTLVIQSFQQQLNTLESQLPAHLKDNEVVLGRIIVARILLYEVALDDTFAQASLMTATERLDLLWRCLAAVRDYMALRFSVLDLQNPRFIALNASDFVFAGQVGMRLLALRAPGWTLPLVREELGLESWIDAQLAELHVIIETRAQSPWNREMTARGLTPPGVDPFIKLQISLKHFRMLLVKEIDKHVPITPPMEQSSPDTGGQQGRQDQHQQEQHQHQQQNLEPMMMDLDMSFFNDFNLTQLDFPSYDNSSTLWDF